MHNIDWGEIIAVFFGCALKPLLTIPAAVKLDLTFTEVFIAGSLGGICGTIFFAFLIPEIVKIYYKLLDRIFPKRQKKKFGWFNRFVIKIKKTFGIVGIAFLAPPISSIPVGVFLALRFFGDRKKVITWMSISIVSWTIVLYFISHTFKNLFS